MADFSRDADDAFTAQRGRLIKKLLRQVRRIKNRLRATFAIAHINENKTAEVASRVDPTRQRHGLADVRRAQFIAMVRSFHLKERGCWPENARNSKRILGKL